LLFPSEYEGFGLPIIEAFKNNCPVVLTSCSCFPEIAGNAGIYFENKNIASFRTAIQSLDDKTIVQEKLAAGKKRLSLFSWENNIKATEKIYTLALK
jgi:glycosyltransferase involved in cell wall biosynthesis